MFTIVGGILIAAAVLGMVNAFPDFFINVIIWAIRLAALLFVLGILAVLFNLAAGGF